MATETTRIREIVHEEIKTVCAAALADPNVNPAAKSFAGYALQYWDRDDQIIAEDRALANNPTAE